MSIGSLTIRNRRLNTWSAAHRVHYAHPPSALYRVHERYVIVGHVLHGLGPRQQRIQRRVHVWGDKIVVNRRGYVEVGEEGQDVA